MQWYYFEEDYVTTWWCGLLTDSSPKVRFRFFLHPLKNRKTRESTCWQKVRAKARYKSKSKKYSACFGTTDGHLTMDGRQAIDARIEQFRNV